jgi:hypothetical protein
MGGELFKKLRTNFEQVYRQIPDTRRPGHNRAVSSQGNRIKIILRGENGVKKF